jgi:MFS family permease
MPADSLSQHARKCSGDTHGKDAGAGVTISGTLSAALGLLTGYAMLITGNGLLGTLISLRLTHAGAPSVLVGIVQSSYYVGFMLGATFGGALISRIGHQRAFVIFAALAACSALSYALSPGPAFWVCLRAITGFCLVGIFAVMESWLHAVATNATRGRIFACYLITTYLGAGTGQFLLNLANPSSFELFTLVGGLFTASLVLVTLGASQTPTNSHHGTGRKSGLGLAGVRTAYRLAPLGLWGCLAAGLLNSAFYTMYPVFMRSTGAPVSSVSHFMGVALVSALLLQWPVARAADRFDRRTVLLAVSLSLAACSLTLFLFHDAGPVALTGYAYVSLLFTIYGLAISHVNDRVTPADRVAVSAGLLLVFSVGGSAGPTLASLVMTAANPAGLYLFTMTVTSVLTLLTLRSLRMHRTPDPVG